jgi:hypothetical protein
MLRWNDAVKALRKLVNPTDAMIEASRRSLERSSSRHAEKGDYWTWYFIFLSLLKSMLMTFDLETTDHSKYYGFAGEVYSIVKTKWPDEAKAKMTEDAGRRWIAHGAQKHVLIKIMQWAEVTKDLRNLDVRPDPKDEIAA